jgi:hypothetical protein
MLDVVIRSARPGERASLEALQWRASLANAGDREPLLADPDAISGGLVDQCLVADVAAARFRAVGLLTTD